MLHETGPRVVMTSNSAFTDFAGVIWEATDLRQAPADLVSGDWRW